MPTITAMALENLIEPGVTEKSIEKTLTGVKNEVHDPKSKPRHLYISPSLYVTPEQAPIPQFDESPPISPSPYLVNHKGRFGGNRLSEGRDLCLEEEIGENFVNGENFGEEIKADEEIFGSRGVVDSVESDEDEGIDICRKVVWSGSFVSSQGEFFDATDDFSSDGSISNTPTYVTSIESELHGTRLHLLEEIESRKAAEISLDMMRSQWERVRKVMFEAGLTFPAPPSDTDNNNSNFLDQLCQELLVTRFVSEAIGRGQGRAEGEEASLAILEAKDQEIVRLRDRLQYYETVNHDMSQRKLVDVARRQQERKRTRRRWAWSLLGLTVSLGASFLAYSYIPHTGSYLSFPKSGEDLTSCISSSDASI